MYFRIVILLIAIMFVCQIMAGNYYVGFGGSIHKFSEGITCQENIVDEVNLSTENAKKEIRFDTGYGYTAMFGKTKDHWDYNLQFDYTHAKYHDIIVEEIYIPNHSYTGDIKIYALSANALYKLYVDDKKYKVTPFVGAGIGMAWVINKLHVHNIITKRQIELRTTISGRLGMDYAITKNLLTSLTFNINIIDKPNALKYYLFNCQYNLNFKYLIN